MKIKRNPPEDMKPKRGGILRKKIYDMVLPGQDLTGRVFGTNQPSQSGLYLVWYKYNPPLAHSEKERHAGREVIEYSVERKAWSVCRTAAVTCAIWTAEQKKWGFNKKILAWMGPLPVLNLEALETYTPGYVLNQTFYVATLKNAANLKYQSGPHAEFLLAFFQPAAKDLFIFVYNSNIFNGLPVPLAIGGADNPSGWRDLTKKEQKKYTKQMKELQK